MQVGLTRFESILSCIVIKAQGMFRAFLAVQRARLYAITKFSERVEPQWRVTAKKTLLKDTNKGSNENIDDKKKGKK